MLHPGLFGQLELPERPGLPVRLQSRHEQKPERRLIDRFLDIVPEPLSAEQRRNITPDLVARDSELTREPFREGAVFGRCVTEEQNAPRHSAGGLIRGSGRSDGRIGRENLGHVGIIEQSGNILYRAILTAQILVHVHRISLPAPYEGMSVRGIEAGGPRPAVAKGYGAARVTRARPATS
ncbi:hypothetical protein Ga0080574_TMP749 [Salipiger abyssi]|uniref:Uncharacterized protein n=1 Tax=Salipiger abyssi TaxID=1250539 RepID=A0A1P8UNX2_9RHOB|nr:hypothetical protein Ga0080574_TMP749 [Salipiger abyssi]